MKTVLQNATIKKERLNFYDLSHMNLDNNAFYNCTMNATSFHSSSLRHTLFDGCELINANFINASTFQTEFEMCLIDYEYKFFIHGIAFESDLSDLEAHILAYKHMLAKACGEYWADVYYYDIAIDDNDIMMKMSISKHNYTYGYELITFI